MTATEIATRWPSLSQSIVQQVMRTSEDRAEAIGLLDAMQRDGDVPVRPVAWRDASERVPVKYSDHIELGGYCLECGRSDGGHFNDCAGVE